MLIQSASKISMTPISICTLSLPLVLSTCLYPHQLLAQTLPETPKNTSTTYEDDRIKVVVQSCNRKFQDLVCQAVLTSKNSDRTVDLNGNNIKIVDFEGNEYRPNSLRLANRNSENNLIRTELVENVPFKASFLFAKIPTNVTKIALFQISLAGGINTTARFRNLIAIEPKVAAAVKPPEPKIVKPTETYVMPAEKVSTINLEAGNNSLICPDNTKMLYRASSRSYLMYICGGKYPTHYVGLMKDGSQGITLRLRYYDRTRFSADNGATNYTIATDRLIVRKDTKIVHQEKIQVLQPLPGVNMTEELAPKNNVKKSKPSANNKAIQKRNSTDRTVLTKIKQKLANNE
jgi:hypothetical protein